jgi:RNA polymerase sigma factor (sigma-70 family)
MAQGRLVGVLRHLRSLRDSQALRDAADSQLLEWFARGREDAPFVALVRRHGPMVWGISRRMLPHVQDAEDVFQATFLLLARKASSIRKSQSVGSWLHGVARRLALKTRLQQARRQAREKRAMDMRKDQPKSEATISDVQATLDGALAELPEKYRAVLVLCYLEGRTQEEAGRHLGCPLATVRTRVARGRKLLHDRLARKGLTLSTAGLGALLIASAATAAPVPLVQTAIKASLSFAAGQPAMALCSKQAASLVEGGLKAMFITKVKTATAVALAVSLLGGAAVLAQRGPATTDPGKPPLMTSTSHEAKEMKPRAAEPKPASSNNNEVVAFAGRVLSPDGRPVAGAKLYVSGFGGYVQEPRPVPVSGTTQADGSFRFTVPKAGFYGYYKVTAAAPNYGPGWVDVRGVRKTHGLTLQLVKDDVPIEGLIVDLEGKPVVGATLTVSQITSGAGEDLGPWLEAMKNNNEDFLAPMRRHLRHCTTGLCPQATTDATGHLRLTGMGSNRLILAQLDGPTIASQHLQILTRPGKPFEVMETKGDPDSGVPGKVATFYGASFRVVAAPGRPIVGVVRDKDTKKPLAGFTIQSHARAVTTDGFEAVHLVRTTTDAEGRYRLNGLPKRDGYWILAIPREGVPYVAVKAPVPNGPGLAAVTVDIDLKQGIWIEGRLKDKATGKPCKGAVEYYALESNPNLSNYPGFDGGMMWRFFASKDDGSYRAVGIPGPGLIAVRSSNIHAYLRADQRDDDYGTKERLVETAPYIMTFPSNYNALARIDPAKGAVAARRDVTLDPGWAFKGTVLGPDGKPLAGASCYDLNRFNNGELERRKTSEFSGWFNPHYPRELLFRYPERGLVGVAHPPKENGGAIRVLLAREAAVIGRLVDAKGNPRAGVDLWPQFHPKGWGSWFDYSPEAVTTDHEGRFRITALVPGYEYRLSDGDNVAAVGEGLRSGETKNLGDVRIELEPD